MNYGETLAYWYLRLNGFFPLRNFVLHPLHESEANDRYTADSDLLAIRFPYVYEEIGGQPEDWDSRFSSWDLSLDKDIIGLIVEVKTSPYLDRSELESNSFNQTRIQQAVQRMGMFKREETTSITNDLVHNSVSAKRGPYHLGKLLFSQGEVGGPWLNIILEEAEQFIQARLKKYSDPKRQARMFFPDELIQYLAWHANRA